MLHGFEFVNGVVKSYERGVSWDKKREKWNVSITKNGKRTFGGAFIHFDDAVSKRNELDPVAAQQSQLIQSGAEVKKCANCKLMFPLSEYPVPEQKTALVRKPLTRCSRCRKKYTDAYHSPAGQKLSKMQRSKRRIGAERTDEEVRKRQVHWQNAKGCKSQLAAMERKRIREKTISSVRIVKNIRNRIWKCLAGKKVGQTSITISTFTEFCSYDEVREHFGKRLKIGMTMENYGAVWSVGHNIPLCWYNRKDPQDLKRANSKANLGCDFQHSGYGELSNAQKGVRLPADDAMLAQGKDSWPLSWGGHLPSVYLRKWIYRHAYRGRFSSK